MDLKQHQIRKQLLDFEFKDKSSALKWQQKVPSQYQREYVKAIENALNQFDDGRCQQIDKIVVDLGMVSEAKVPDQLGKALSDILNKTLLKNVHHYEMTNIDLTTKSTIDLQVNSGKEELLFIFRHFIAHGNFPWNVTVKAVSELETSLLEQYTIDELVARLIAKKVFLGAWEKARFFYQFEPLFVSEVFAKYFAKQYEDLRSIIDYCEKQFGKATFSPHFKRAPVPIASQDVVEWIALFAPLDKGLWPAEFIPWFMERQWNSEIPFKYVSMWVSTNVAVQKDSNPHFIEYHLKKIFRHLDLHLAAISKDDTFKRSKSTNLKEQTITPQIAPTENEKTYDGEMDKDDALEVSNRQKEALKDLEKIDEGEQEITAEPFKKDPQEQIVGSTLAEEGDKDIPSKAIEKDLEAIVQTEEKGLTNKPQDEAGHRFLNDDKSVRGNSELNQSTPEDDLIVSGEFYKEVQETIDAAVPKGKELWNTVETNNYNTSEPYYIKDSGLVLVWPYLNRLFEKLNYVKGKEFESKELQERAVALLGYIATGNPICEEHQLVFAKFLCGWPLRMPVKKVVKLKKKELNEANAMLIGLISNWTVLKNTSVNGLRETFFNRDGKLKEKEDGWKLTVEQRGTDILLDQLPYGISIIKLPWLNNLLRVDWS